MAKRPPAPSPLPLLLRVRRDPAPRGSARARRRRDCPLHLSHLARRTNVSLVSLCLTAPVSRGLSQPQGQEGLCLTPLSCPHLDSSWPCPGNHKIRRSNLERCRGGGRPHRSRQRRPLRKHRRLPSTRAGSGWGAWRKPPACDMQPAHSGRQGRSQDPDRLRELAARRGRGPVP